MKKSNRPRKFGDQKTDRITVRVPLEHKELIKKKIYDILKKYEK